MDEQIPDLGEVQTNSLCRLRVHLLLHHLVDHTWQANQLNVDLKLFLGDLQQHLDLARVVLRTGYALLLHCCLHALELLKHNLAAALQLKELAGGGRGVVPEQSLVQSAR